MQDHYDMEQKILAIKERVEDVGRKENTGVRGNMIAA